MIACAVLAIIAANSPFSQLYKSFIYFPVNLGYGNYSATESLKDWVKDILMVFFFLTVSMELKREMCEGFLAKREQIILPFFAAIGGMLVPSLIFTALNYKSPENMNGWAICSATDIAFAICILTLIGKNVAPAAKIFLLAIAIFDDLGAILIIALFYSNTLTFMPLAFALIGVAIIAIFNLLNVTKIFLYFIVGIYLWLCLYCGGIHTTIAGVIVGMAIPLHDKNKAGHSPLIKTMDLLHPWVSYFILPLFAFTSAGISMGGIKFSDIVAPLPLGIALGLFLGKQIGIFGSVFLLVKTGFAEKPAGTSWLDIYGISVLAGIGFTMSMFIGFLAFSDIHMQEMVKIGVMAGSLLSTLFALIIFRYGRFISGNKR